MNSANYEVLGKMLKEFQIEQNEIEKKISENLLKIQEAQYYTNSFLEKEDNDFKIFSPRNAESVYKEELTCSREKEAFYKEENAKLNLQLEGLHSKINSLKKIMEEEVIYNYSILNIQEADRHRIARELHDTSLQNLAHLVHKIELATKFIDKDRMRAKLELSVVNKNLKTVIEEIRNTIYDLRPMTFDDLGLKATFERLISVINQNKKFAIDMDIDDVSCENNLILVTIYRIVQECLNNIIKHADAEKIILHCKLIDNIYVINIEDDGKGFTNEEAEQKKAEKHFGVTLMKERVALIGGTIQIDSICNKGTKIKIKIPLEHGEV